jgi:TldD protein
MLDDSMLSRLISRALRRGAEFADVFCERRHAVAYRLQDGKIHDSSYAVTQGVGIRVVTGESRATPIPTT